MVHIILTKVKYIVYYQFVDSYHCNDSYKPGLNKGINLEHL